MLLFFIYIFMVKSNNRDLCVKLYPLSTKYCKLYLINVCVDFFMANSALMKIINFNLGESEQKMPNLSST